VLNLSKFSPTFSLTTPLIRDFVICIEHNYGNRLFTENTSLLILFVYSNGTALILHKLTLFVQIFFQRTSKGMLMPQSRMQTFLANTVCRDRITQELICEKCIIFSVCGSDPHFFDNVITNI